MDFKVKNYIGVRLIIDNVLMGVIMVKGDFDIDKLQNTVNRIVEKNNLLDDIEIVQKLQKVYPDLEMGYIDRLYDLEI